MPTQSEIRKTLEYSLSFVDDVKFYCLPDNVLSITDKIGNFIVLEPADTAFVVPTDGSYDIYLNPIYFQELDSNNSERFFIHELIHLSLPYQSLLEEIRGRACATKLAVKNTKAAKLNADSYAVFVQDVNRVLDDPNLKVGSVDFSGCLPRI